MVNILADPRSAGPARILRGESAPAAHVPPDGCVKIRNAPIDPVIEIDHMELHRDEAQSAIMRDCNTDRDAPMLYNLSVHNKSAACSSHLKI
jgi:hypothetical protein